MYDHGFMDNTNRQAVCISQKNPLSDSQTAEELHYITAYIYSKFVGDDLLVFLSS